MWTEITRRKYEREERNRPVMAALHVGGVSGW